MSIRFVRIPDQSPACLPACLPALPRDIQTAKARKKQKKKHMIYKIRKAMRNPLHAVPRSKKNTLSPTHTLTHHDPFFSSTPSMQTCKHADIKKKKEAKNAQIIEKRKKKKEKKERENKRYICIFFFFSQSPSLHECFAAFHSGKYIYIPLNPLKKEGKKKNITQKKRKGKKKN